nr:immunoglobulin light chain junction region [Macaca mulatta]
GQHYYSTPCSF